MIEILCDPVTWQVLADILLAIGVAFNYFLTKRGNKNGV